MKESVSLVIPAYNSEKTIGKCLESVFASDIAKSEVIVVDDCSKDNTVGVAGKFPCKIIKNKKNSGAAATRNAGAIKARGDILLFIDSDATVQSDLLSRAVETFAKHPEISAWVGTFSKKHCHNGIASQYKNLHFYYYSTNMPFYTTGLNSAIAAIKRKAFFAVGGFDEKKKTVAEDVDLGMRLSRAGFLIHQSKSIEVEHLKNLSFSSLVKNDFERGKSIAKSLLSLLLNGKGTPEKKKGKNSKPFSLLQHKEIYFSIPIPFLALLSLAAGFLNNAFFFAAGFLLFSFAALNAGFWGFILKERGFLFAVAAIGITFFDMLVFFAGICSGIAASARETLAPGAEQ